MPRYFFHTQDGQFIRDEVGEVLAGDGAARAAALTILGEILRYRGEEFWESECFTVIVTDEDGRTLTKLMTFAEPPSVDGENSACN